MTLRCLEPERAPEDAAKHEVAVDPMPAAWPDAVRPAPPRPIDLRKIDYQAEECFHDEWGHAIDPETVPVVESFEACTAPENRHIMAWLGDVSGLRVLDLGCGAGEAAVYFARQGARVTAVDLSQAMLDVTSRVAKRFGVRVECRQQNADLLDLPEQSFDVVYAANLLHHVDIERCLASVERVLKPDGRFVSWDPLRHNPVINVYRRMAAAVRSDDETPLGISDLKKIGAHFQQVEHRCFWFASLWLFVKFFVFERLHPSKERYWKRIIVDAERLSGSYRRLAAIDNILLKCVPWLRRMCWNLVVCAHRPRVWAGERGALGTDLGRSTALNIEIPRYHANAPREPIVGGRSATCTEKSSCTGKSSAVCKSNQQSAISFQLSAVSGQLCYAV